DGPLLDEAREAIDNLTLKSEKYLMGELVFAGFDRSIPGEKLAGEQDIDRLVGAILPSILESLRARIQVGVRPIVSVFPVTVDHSLDRIDAGLGRQTDQSKLVRPLADQIQRKLLEALRSEAHHGFVVIDGGERLRQREISFPETGFVDVNMRLALCHMS